MMQPWQKETKQLNFRSNSVAGTRQNLEKIDVAEKVIILESI
jgi:hypothetical protein